ncbi:DNA (cytosine-5-)-methyltransferase [Pseudomonas congelans]|uniref:DNA cytosine methyltransferase n=1 Tax=Pseudomonas congelans TaxID=200452 RepID=UPI000BB64DBF|nr:DNA cytosine methyltransferase [Pseudomonas congelans]PBQ02725.1 DNA (cytosine-5-)-methyltransferase [Pseudomonas congelans]
MRNIHKEKIARIHGGEVPKVLDLFAGCGGISLGFHRAGFKNVAAVEFDAHAARSHALNFHKDLPSQQFEKHAQAHDITKIEPSSFIQDMGFSGPADRAIDVIVGGPPCQAFARVGRAKLREVAEHPQAFKQDPRGNLYLRYLHFVRELKPIAILMENVPDVLNYGGHNIAEEMCETLEDLGYDCGYTLLNAVYYGVPEMRERMFLIAYSKELNKKVSFPSPSNWIDLPRGYDNSRKVALKNINIDLLTEDHYFVMPPTATSTTCKPAVTAESALGDLPKITKHLEEEVKKGARSPREESSYPDGSVMSDYSLLMRTWPGFESHGVVYGHVTRSLPRDYPIFARMNPGDQYPEAFNHAVDLFNEEIKKRALRGEAVDEASLAYKDLYKLYVPPYDPTKFPNKWRKMEADKPARTLMAHLGKDGYSHIHYDSSQARTISVREAARLQSFPDGFTFSGSMNPAFKQIGNAVPPLLAYAIAKEIMRNIKE